MLTLQSDVSVHESCHQHPAQSGPWTKSTTVLGEALRVSPRLEAYDSPSASPNPPPNRGPWARILREPAHAPDASKPQCLRELREAAVTTCQKLGALKQLGSILPPSWGLGVENQGVGRVSLSREALGEDLLLAPSSFQWPLAAGIPGRAATPSKLRLRLRIAVSSLCPFHAVPLTRTLVTGVRARRITQDRLLSSRPSPFSCVQNARFPNQVPFTSPKEWDAGTSFWVQPFSIPFSTLSCLHL